MNYCLDFPRWAQTICQWLFDWQTLVSGMLALTAGLATVFFLWRQIRQSADRERAELLRRHRAEMAVFGLTLAKLCDAVVTAERGCARLLLLDLEMRADCADGSDKFVISDEIINGLYQFIASTDDARLVGVTSTICHHIQIRQSRQRGEGTQDSILQLAIIELAGIYAMCESLFRYARGEKVKPPTEVFWQKAKLALTIPRLDLDRLPELNKLLDMHISAHTTVWSLDD